MKWLRSIFRGIKVPGTYTIIFAMILLSALLTWFVPGGEYVKGEEGTLSYRDVESVPQFFGVFTALYHGFVKQSGIIIFILIVGGSFWLLNSTGAISVGIGRFIRAVGRYHKVVLVAITLLFSLAGAIFGMSEETIPFVGIVVPLVVSMGYDAFLGMLIVYVAANVGFSSAFLNPFTVGIAQEMAELPLFSGMEYRLFCWAILTLLLILFVLFYAKSVYKAPQAAAEQQPFAAPQPCSQRMSANFCTSANCRTAGSRGAAALSAEDECGAKDYSAYSLCNHSSTCCGCYPVGLVYGRDIGTLFGNGNSIGNSGRV